MRLTRKLLIPTLIALSILLIAIFGYFSATTVQKFNDSERAYLENVNLQFQTSIKAKQDMAVALALEVANNPQVQSAFAAGDRARLIELTLPGYEALDAQFDIPQFQFHVAPAVSFLRLHNLEQYGDDLSSFRKTVLIANQEHQVVSGAEIGRGGLGVRGVVPVVYQGKYIGTVEFGPNIDLKMLEEIKAKYGSEMQILLERNAAEVATFTGAVEESQGPTGDLILQASTLETPFFGPESNYSQALEGVTSVVHFDREGHSYAILSAPLYDFSGEVIGIIDIISDHSAIAQEQSRQILAYAGVLVLILLFIGLGFGYLAGRVLNPIGALTIVSSAIARGDFSRQVQAQSNDEIGVLANTFNSMSAQLQTTLQELEKRVADRTKALATSTEVSRRLSTILDQSQLVKSVVEEVRNSFNYYHTHIYLFDDEQKELIMAGGTGDAGRKMLERGHKLAKGQGLVGRAAQSNEPVLVADTSQSPEWLPNPLLPDTKSEVAIPIAIGHQVLGVLDVQHNIVDGLKREDVDALQSIANQVAIAVQNSRSYAEVQKNQTLLSDALAAARLGNWEYDFEKDLFTFSDDFYAIFRTTADKVGGYKISSADYAKNFVHPEDASLVGSEIQKVIESKERRFTTQLEHRIIFPDNEVGYISVNINVERDENGKITRWYGANQDITERRRLEEINRKRAEQQEAINQITQKIQSATTIEAALQMAARELGHALGRKPTIITIEPPAQLGDKAS